LGKRWRATDAGKKMEQETSSTLSWPPSSVQKKDNYFISVHNAGVSSRLFPVAEERPASRSHFVVDAKNQSLMQKWNLSVAEDVEEMKEEERSGVKTRD
jgi:hypothetical protein